MSESKKKFEGDPEFSQHTLDILKVLQKNHETFSEAADAMQEELAPNLDPSFLQQKPCLSCGTIENTTGCPKCTLVHWCENKECQDAAKAFHADRCSLAFNPIMYSHSTSAVYSVSLPQTITIHMCYVCSFVRDARSSLQKRKVLAQFFKKYQAMWKPLQAPLKPETTIVQLVNGSMLTLLLRMGHDLLSPSEYDVLVKLCHDKACMHCGNDLVEKVACGKCAYATYCSDTCKNDDLETHQHLCRCLKDSV